MHLHIWTELLVEESKMLPTARVCSSGVASPKLFLGGKVYDFRRITLFCLEKRLSKHKMTIFSKIFFGGNGPFGPPLATPMVCSKTSHSVSAHSKTYIRTKT